MDARPPDRFEELLTRAFDGELAPGEREELDALAGVEPRLAAMAELRDALRAALAEPGPVDVAGEVMGVLAAEAEWAFGDAVRAAVTTPVDVADGVFAALDAEWSFGDALREAVAGPVDVADGVMEGLDEAPWVGAELRAALSQPVDLADGILASIHEDVDLPDGIGIALRDAVARPVDVWAGVADGIGVERDVVHGWDEVAAPLRAAFAAIPRIDVADAVMAAVQPVARVAPVRTMPRWASLGGPVVAFAAAAMMLLSVLPQGPMPTRMPSDGGGVQVQLATVNDAQVEEVTAPQDVVVQVMQFEEGGPTFILVDDPSGNGVPL